MECWMDGWIIGLALILVPFLFSLFWDGSTFLILFLIFSPYFFRCNKLIPLHDCSYFSTEIASKMVSPVLCFFEATFKKRNTALINLNKPQVPSSGIMMASSLVTRKNQTAMRINPLVPNNRYNCTYGLFLFLRFNCRKKLILNC